MRRTFNEYSLKSLFKEILLLILSLILIASLIKNDLTKYYKKSIDINTEPVTNRPMRSAAIKARLVLKTSF